MASRQNGSSTQFSQSASWTPGPLPTPCQVPVADQPFLKYTLRVSSGSSTSSLRAMTVMRRGTFQSSSVNLTLIDVPPLGRYGLVSAQPDASAKVTSGWSVLNSVHE